MKTFGKSFQTKELEFINSFIEEDAPVTGNHIPVWYLAKSIEKLAEADFAYFISGWQTARGCYIEHQVARIYDIESYDED